MPKLSAAGFCVSLLALALSHVLRLVDHYSGTVAPFSGKTSRASTANASRPWAATRSCPSTAPVEVQERFAAHGGLRLRYSRDPVSPTERQDPVVVN